MNGPWKEEDSAFVDSFFLPGGILDPEDEEEIGILSTLPTGQPIPSNPWGNEKAPSTPSSAASYLHAVKQIEIESAASPNMFGERTVGEAEVRMNSPLRSIVRPPPGYDGYVNGLAPNSQHFPNNVSRMGSNHSNVLPTSHMNQASPVHCDGLSHLQNGFLINMNRTCSPNQSNMRYQLSQQGSIPAGQHLPPVDSYSTRGSSLSVPSLAIEVNPKQRNVQCVQSDQSTSATLKSNEEASTSKQNVQNPRIETSVQEIRLKLENEGSKEEVPERNSITSTTVDTGDSIDASSHMIPSCDSKDEVSEHAPQHIVSGVLSHEQNSVGEYSESQSTIDDHSTKDTAVLNKSSSLLEIDDEMSNVDGKTEGRRHSAATCLGHHTSKVAQGAATSSSSNVTQSPQIRYSMSLLQGILRPFSLVFRMVTLLLLDLPRTGANTIASFFATVYYWILSTARRVRVEVVPVTKIIAHSISDNAKRSGASAKGGALLLVRNLSLVPSFVRMMTKASMVQVMEEPSSGFCYLVLYLLPSWCNSLAENFDVPHWSAHFIITIAVYLVSHPVKPGILHRGEFPLAEVIEALFRNGNHCDQAFIDKDERRAAARKRNERICSKCLRVLRYCLPIFCLIDGFSYDGATMIGDSGASRLTTAFMMSLVRRNLAFSPIGWVSWAIQVLVATYLDVWVLRDTMVLLLGLSSFRLIRYFDQKRLKKKRKRR
ncbi:unnamed protein product [Cylindrotheca closterium]|uniref:Uncharacterized protein n=1 Tax=Cylindrotheca closterium TaxID=2856 RepID=A0AAD2FTB1_9STRA|nr:unnamed protein product [Cylindrotheca closterium]